MEENFKNFNACTVLTRLYQIKAEQDGMKDVRVTVTESTPGQIEQMRNRQKEKAYSRMSFPSVKTVTANARNLANTAHKTAAAAASWCCPAAQGRRWSPSAPWRP